MNFHFLLMTKALSYSVKVVGQNAIATTALPPCKPRVFFVSSLAMRRRLRIHTCRHRYGTTVVGFLMQNPDNPCP